MGTEIRKHLADLKEELLRHGREYSFFYAAYLGELSAGKDDGAATPDRLDVTRLDQKNIRFRPSISYGFPAADIESIRETPEGLEFVLTFSGLYGVNAALPQCYQEQIIMQSGGAPRVPLQDFLDIFNNRLYWLLYQAWKKHRYYLALSDDYRAPIMQRLLCFLGIGLELERDVSASGSTELAEVSRRAAGKPSPLRLVKYSGLLANRVRNASGLLSILRDYFKGVPCRIQEFYPTWTALPQRQSLADTEAEGGFCLGHNAIVGDKILDYSGRIGLHFGPMEAGTYFDFIPGGKKAKQLQRLLAIYLKDGLEYDLIFYLSTAGIESAQLKAENDPRGMLGFGTWLGRPAAAVIQRQFTYEEYGGATE